MVLPTVGWISSWARQSQIDMPIGQPDPDNSSIETHSQGGSRLWWMAFKTDHRKAWSHRVPHTLSHCHKSPWRESGDGCSPGLLTAEWLHHYLAFSDPGDKTINMAHAVVNTVLVSKGRGCGYTYFIWPEGSNFVWTSVAPPAVLYLRLMSRRMWALLLWVPRELGISCWHFCLVVLWALLLDELWDILSRIQDLSTDIWSWRVASLFAPDCGQTQHGMVLHCYIAPKASRAQQSK